MIELRGKVWVFKVGKHRDETLDLVATEDRAYMDWVRREVMRKLPTVAQEALQQVLAEYEIAGDGDEDEDVYFPSNSPWADRRAKSY